MEKPSGSARLSLPAASGLLPGGERLSSSVFKAEKGANLQLAEKRADQKRHIAGSFYLLLILLILLTTATYTWFSLSKTPRVSDLYLTVNAGAGLELTLDLQSEDWGQQINFADTLADVTPLKPVTWSQRDQRFYAAVFGADGRIAGIQQPLSDEHNANRSDSSGYYVKGTFYARTGSRSPSPCLRRWKSTRGRRGREPISSARRCGMSKPFSMITAAGERNTPCASACG